MAAINKVAMSPALTSGVGRRYGTNTAAAVLRGHGQTASTPRTLARSMTTVIDRNKAERERVVILGSGWAGYTLARNLDPKQYQAVVVSPRSHFVFTPLLASTAVGTLEFRTACEPIRSLRSRHSKVEFFQGWADTVNFAAKMLSIEEAAEDDWPRQKAEKKKDGSKKQKGKMFDMSYDKLVVGVGCYSQTFDTPGVKENAYFLKDIGDASKIRNRLLSCFETAYLPTTSVETKKQLLNFAIVGGGPTGIEFSAELHDLVTEDMAKIYPELMQYSRITVYDVADKVLTMFDDKLATYALDHFKREGIHVRTCHHVKSLRRGSPNQQLGDNSSNDLANCYTLDTKEDGQVGVGMVVWSTGLMANPFIQKSLATPHSLPRKSAAFEISQQPADGNEKWRIATNPRNGGIMTNDRLRVLMQPPFSSSASTTNPQDTRTTGTNNTINTNNRAIINNVFALGDCAVIEHTTLPATGQVADQQARWLAKRLNAHDMDKPSTQGFAYKDLGVMAYVGSWKAIVQTKPADVSGRTAWFMWRGAYLAKSMSWRNRILILIYWTVNWLFGRDISRF